MFIQKVIRLSIWYWWAHHLRGSPFRPLLLPVRYLGTSMLLSQSLQLRLAQSSCLSIFQLLFGTPRALKGCIRSDCVVPTVIGSGNVTLSTISCPLGLSPGNHIRVWCEALTCHQCSTTKHLEKWIYRHRSLLRCLASWMKNTQLKKIKMLLGQQQLCPNGIF